MENANWLKWIVFRQVDGGVVLSTVDILMDRYPYKPPDVKGEFCFR